MQKHWYQDNQSANDGTQSLHSDALKVVGDTLDLDLPTKDFAQFKMWVRPDPFVGFGVWVDGVRDTSASWTAPILQNYALWSTTHAAGSHSLKLRAWLKYSGGTGQIAVDGLRWSK